MTETKTLSAATKKRRQIEELMAERLRFADERLRWTVEKARLMKLIFQLSEALEHEKHH